MLEKICNRLIIYLPKFGVIDLCPVVEFSVLVCSIQIYLLSDIRPTLLLLFKKKKKKTTYVCIYEYLPDMISRQKGFLHFEIKFAVKWNTLKKQNRNLIHKINVNKIT